jgi:protein-tyrosine phosphatase
VSDEDKAGVPGVDATEIVPGLFVGAAPRPGLVTHVDFDVLVLSTEEYQPGEDMFPGVEVWRVKLGDDPDKQLDLKSVQHAVKMGRKVAKAVAGGDRVLVTCARGLNRSAFIAALALMTLGQGRLGAEQAVDMLKERRGDDVLGESDVWMQVLKRYFAR